MNLFDRVKSLADERKVSISELERHIGASTNSLYKWKTQKPKIDKVEAVAEYFNVSTDYLLGRTDIKEKADELESLAAHKDGLNLTPEEEEAIKRFVKHVLRNEE